MIMLLMVATIAENVFVFTKMAHRFHPAFSFLFSLKFIAGRNINKV